MNGTHPITLSGGDLRVFNLNLGEGFADRIYISHGTRKIEGARAERSFYLSPSYVPRTPFARPSVEELVSLVSTARQFDPAKHVGLVSIPGKLWKPVVDVLSRYGWNEQRARGAVACGAAVQVLEEGLAAMFGDGGPYQSHGLSSHAAALVTVTVNRSQGAYNGLHLDSWDGVTLNDRRRSRVRVCLNLGPEHRYFLFLNRSSLQLTSSELDPTARADSTLGRSFMDANPEYPLVALKLNPGEAYVAATDLIFHDASTIGATRRVLTLQVRVPLRTLTSKSILESPLAAVE